MARTSHRPGARLMRRPRVAISSTSCDDCGAQIRWVYLAGIGWRPINDWPDPTGTIVLESSGRPIEYRLHGCPDAGQ